MKKITFLILILCCSCSLRDAYLKNNFLKFSEKNFYDTELKIKKNNTTIEKIEIIKIKNYKEFLQAVINLSTKDYKPAHYIEFSTNRNYILDENYLKIKMNSNNCDLLVYNEMLGVKNVFLKSDFEKIEMDFDKDYLYFTAVFLCK